MRISNVAISNFRSISSAETNGLQSVNVLIGRNNSGKSNYLAALGAVAHACTGEPLVEPIPSWPESLPFRDPTKTTAVEIEFTLDETERTALIEEAFRTATDGWPVSQAQFSETHFARTARVFCKSTTAASLLQVDKIELLGEDGGSPGITIQEGNKVVNLFEQMREHISTGNQVNYMSIRKDRGSTFSGGIPQDITQISSDSHSSGIAGLRLIRSYFDRAFFFGTSRKGIETLQVAQTNRLSSDGSNLAGVLNTLTQNDRHKFDEIDSLLHAALPDAGSLRAALSGNMTQVTLHDNQFSVDLKLRELGSGVEQLLLILTSLVTSKSKPVLLIEEPETNLHPQAQRFVQQLIAERASQSFLTTHSPVFLSGSFSTHVLRVEHSTSGSSNISETKEMKELSLALRSIGARNSDLLFSDRVLFVEGSSDRELMLGFADTLDVSLAAHGVNVLITGGAEFAGRQLPLRSDLIEKVSENSLGIPHWFLIDKDERSEGELKGLNNKLGEKIFILTKRELENYLLSPELIQSVVKDKYFANANVVRKVTECSPDQIETWIDEIAIDLKMTVLCKRIRSEIGGLPNGLVPRDKVASLISSGSESNLVSGFQKIISETWDEAVDSKRIAQIVEQQRTMVNELWADRSARISAAPGDEIIDAVFGKFSVPDCKVRFNKVKDARYFVLAIQPHQIATEIRDIISRVTAANST